jgi:uncharacterized GH25 family protein/protocatechuate 3,4-dioxygenase beta subunit
MRARLLSILTFLISLPLTASVTGIVINTDGQPIAGAKVSIYAPETVAARRLRLFSKTVERTALATRQTDSKGNFSFDSPKDQPLVDLRVEANGFAPDAERLLADDDTGAIALTSATMQRGTITTNGKPVAGANVVWLGNSTESIATTDADGHYSVPDPAKWANRVIVIHPDYAVVDEVTGLLRTPPKLNHDLNAGVTIKGRVVGENGQSAVAKAPLLVDDLPLATTADDGTFTIEHAPKNWQEVEARSGPLAGVRARASDSAVAIRLAKLGKITGNVRDAKSQLPLVNAEVRIGPAMPLGRMRGFGAAGTAPAQDSVLTDAKGTFTISAPPGHYSLSAVYPGSMVANATISLSAGQTVNKALYGNARGRVSGMVVDENKRGIAGARLSARNANRDGGNPMLIGPPRFQQELPAFSGPDGRFVVRMVPTESDVQIDAAKKGLPAAHSASVHLNPGEKKSGVLITVPRGVAFSGKVIDANGKPISGVGVEPVESTGRGGFAAGLRRVVVSMLRDREDEVVRTGSDGTFSVRVKEGTYDVVFKREGFATKTLHAETVNALTKPVEVKLDPGVEISGRVVRNGVGVEGVNINAMREETPASAVTASDGSFTLTDLTPGPVMLAASKMDSFILQNRSVTAPARDVIIQLPAGGRITGRVVDKSNHSPVTSFQAGISMSRGAGGMMIALPPMLKGFTSDDGSFTLENVPPGPTQLVVSAPGYTTAHIPGLNVEDGKTVNDVEVALDTGVRLTGRVTGPDGAPVSGVSVRESGSNMGPMRFMTGGEAPATTDPNGEYSIEAIDPGQKTFTFQRQGFLAEDRTVTLSGREARLDVQLSSGVSLNGVVVTDAGAPVADAMVNAMSASDAAFGRQGRTDANGSFQIAGLAPGHYTISASKQGLTEGILRDFDLSTGAPARIVMRNGGTIAGHVIGLTATELGNTVVTANSANGGAQAEVDSSGAYHIDGAPTGTVRVSARTGRGFAAGAKTSPMQSVQVDPGASVQVDIQFKSSTVVRGRVTRNGQPMPNVMVMFVPRGSQTQTQASGTADSNGAYEITGLDDGTYSVGVLDIDRSNAFSSAYEVHGSGTFDIDIKTGTLRGRVIDSSTGEPLANAQIQIQPKQGGFFSARSVVTDPAGSFVVDNIARGSYQATAQKDGYGHDVRDLTIGDSAPDDLEFKLSPSSGVTLRVVDGRDNRALSANVMRVVDAQGRTLEGSGGFRYNPSTEPVTLTLAPGTYTVTLTAMDYAPKSINVTSPSDITVQMMPGGSLVLRSKSSTQQRVRLIDSKGAIYPRGPNGIFTLDPSPLTTTVNNVTGGVWTLQVLNSADQVINSIPITIVDGQQAVMDV